MFWKCSQLMGTISHKLTVSYKTCRVTELGVVSWWMFLHTNMWLVAMATNKKKYRNFVLWHRARERLSNNGNCFLFASRPSRKCSHKKKCVSNTANQVNSEVSQAWNHPIITQERSSKDQVWPLSFDQAHLLLETLCPIMQKNMKKGQLFNLKKKDMRICFPYETKGYRAKNRGLLVKYCEPQTCGNRHLCQRHKS